jgi:hypothetical protein
MDLIHKSLSAPGTGFNLLKAHASGGVKMHQNRRDKNV